MARRSFGTVRRLASGRYQARYRDPQGRQRSAGGTFATKREATQWLSAQETAIGSNRWRSPEAQAERFAQYAADWLEHRELKPRTRAEYAGLLRRQVLPDLGSLPLVKISPTVIRDWYARMDERTGKTERARAASVVAESISARR